MFIVGMLSVAPPPTKPRGFSKTKQKPKHHYTIHSKPNDIFTLKPDENRTAIVAFTKIDDAFLLSQMIESYYIHQKELPLFGSDEMVILPSPVLTNSLNYLYIQRWDIEELKVECTKNILDMIIVEKLKDSKDGYTISGQVYKFEAPVDFYKIRFEELLPINNDPDDGPY
jgi:hypothetical protein